MLLVLLPVPFGWGGCFLEILRVSHRSESLILQVVQIISFPVSYTHLTDDETLRRINRGHTFAVSAEAVRKTAERGILVGGHIILGLLGEDVYKRQVWSLIVLFRLVLPFIC